ncbi:hypothetical protein FHS51_000063 [Sphingobium wenxiniae]|uniref:Antitoxin Xre/MbcA/ParS-like toxin-binding domain-containing protein n=1 Tax=Sphingobium wenxiniae (strain DSM 21828 / CGMCC 1.7748 / JZ-1) TaxID=595605 RepID=A0A562KQW9_SPHWJ|nr:hypothetical protein [Sphingobium wenxiniae]MBB6189860.1 hypothetical protein [Sphingobium wenxiniae]TWH97818.1 hypothetical protein IQ35_00418 [Sphingobium wenxiniae]
MARQFRKNAGGPRLSPEQAVRQGRISQLAIARVGAQNAIAFLNGHDEALGARPLDLAIESAAGLHAAEQLLLDRTGG